MNIYNNFIEQVNIIMSHITIVTPKASNSGFATVTKSWNAAVQPVFEIDDDTEYDLTGISVDLTGCTNASTWTFQFNRAYAAVGADYREAAAPTTVVVGTDKPVIEISNWAAFGYTKLTATSDAAADDGKTIKFTWIKKPMNE